MRVRTAAALLLLLAAAPVQVLSLPSPGQKAPEFELTIPDGKIVSSDSLRGGYTLLVFFASYCSECRQGLTRLAESWGSCENSGSIRVVLVGVGGSEDANWESVQSLGVSGWMFVQDDREIWRDFGVRFLGSWVFIGPDWTVLTAGEGEIDLNVICRLAAPPSTTPVAGYSVYKGWVDRQAAEFIASRMGLETSTAAPAGADMVVVVGGPLANPSAIPILEEAGISFNRTAEGVELRLPNGTVLVVGGADWAWHDYAVVFSIDRGGVLWVGAMGCTRYGTLAAATWAAHHQPMLKPGVGYLLEWSDLNGDGDVQIGEVRVAATFEFP
ncbi:MAG: TlpA disulfide reductase family protein [Candidatus Korarchaeota archaeon]|nr:TlpA disulfide reductase family protein [Candidatus Korarchaeota archaeon]